MQERDARRAVGVVLDVRDGGEDAVLVVALEVDDAVLALVPTTDVTGGDATGVVATTVLGEGRSRDFSGVERVISAKSATDEPRRPGVVGLYLRMAIGVFLVPVSADSREDVDGARLEGDDGALGVLALAHPELGPAGLALLVERVDRRDLHAEDLLDRELDLGLVRAGSTMNVYLPWSIRP